MSVREDGGFSPVDLLDVADGILDMMEGHSPVVSVQIMQGWLRTVLNRSYYASFLSIKTSFSGDPELAKIFKRGAGIHSALLKYLRKNLPEDLLFLAKILKYLMGQRILADYSLPGQFVTDVCHAGICAIMSRYLVSRVPEMTERIQRTRL